MSNYHKPRTFRSLQGCCICKAKSSTSRFTDSEKYEEDFRRCFRVLDDRTGDICNACVLLVKRWKKLPKGSKKNWNHVVDARAVPGVSHKTATTLVRQRSKQQTTREDPDLKPKKIIKRRVSSTAGRQTPSTPDLECSKPEFCTSPVPTDISEDSLASGSLTGEEVSPFLDLAYWKRTKVCCGIVFIGQHNDLVIDVNLYRPCSMHTKASSRAGSASTRSRADTLSSKDSTTTPDSPSEPTPECAG